MNPTPGYSLLAAILAIVSLPGIAVAQTWHGQIKRATIPGLTTKPLVGAFAVTMSGSRLTYSRPVHKADLAALSGATESGTGTLAGSDIDLQGGAAGKGYSYTATYQGQIEDGRALLAGEQVWTVASPSEVFHRACHITLTR